MTPDARYRPRPDVVATDLEQELILLDPTTSEMFSLNRTGRLIWRLLPERTIGGIAEALVESSAVEYQQALADVQSVVADLTARGLIEPE